MTHEITMKSHEEIDENKKKREIVFKTFSSHTHEDSHDEEESDEEMALFTRKFNKIFKKGKFPQR